MNETIYIYGLVDPNTNEIRYVGRTNNPKRRLGYHMRCYSGPKSEWLRTLKKAGQRPRLIVLDHATKETQKEKEFDMILFLKEQGVDLLNAIFPGYVHASRGMSRVP